MPPKRTYNLLLPLPTALKLGALVEGGHGLIGRTGLDLHVVCAVVLAARAGSYRRQHNRANNASETLQIKLKETPTNIDDLLGLPSVWSTLAQASSPPRTSSTCFRSRVFRCTIYVAGQGQMTTY